MVALIIDGFLDFGGSEDYILVQSEARKHGATGHQTSQQESGRNHRRTPLHCQGIYALNAPGSL